MCHDPFFAHVHFFKFTIVLLILIWSVLSFHQQISVNPDGSAGEPFVLTSLLWLATEFQQSFCQVDNFTVSPVEGASLQDDFTSTLSIKPTFPVTLEKHIYNLISFNKKLFVFLHRTLHSLLPPKKWTDTGIFSVASKLSWYKL